MTRNELYDKFLKLTVNLDNLYQNSDLDITQEEYDEISNWLKNISWVLGFEPRDFSEENLKTFERTYDEAVNKIYSKRS